MKKKEEQQIMCKYTHMLACTYKLSSVYHWDCHDLRNRLIPQQMALEDMRILSQREINKFKAECL